jgi:large subunit ribosomal protein L10
MTKEEKNQLIDSLAEKLAATNIVYLTDISNLNSEITNKLRGLCFRRNVKLEVVKNTLLKKAMDKTEKNFEGLYVALHGQTSIMIADNGNAPAKLIKEFRRSSDKPVLKGAYIDEMVFVGDDQLDFLANLRSKTELIADVIALLQSPVRNVMASLQSGGQKLSGILETLSEKAE